MYILKIKSFHNMWIKVILQLLTYIEGHNTEKWLWQNITGRNYTWKRNECFYPNHTFEYRVVISIIQGDQKVSVHLMITIQKVTSNVQIVPRQSPFIDTPKCVLEDRVQYSTVHIPNVFCDRHLQIINCVGIVRIHWDILVTLYFTTVLLKLLQQTLRQSVTSSSARLKSLIVRHRHC
jgi:hypothetical protein